MIKYISLILNWLFGLLFLLAGIVTMVGNSFLQGLPLIIAALLLIPTVRIFLYKKTNIELSEKVRLWSIFALLISLGIISEIEKNTAIKQQELLKAKEQAEKIAEIQKQKIDYFKTNREKIITSLKENFTAGEYQLVITESNKHLIAKDEELTDININAIKKLEEIKKADKIKELIKQLSTLSTTDYKNHIKIYQELIKLAPVNKEYKTKLADYNEKNKIENERLAKIKKIEKTKELLAQLKTTPTKEYWKNKTLYQQLSTMHPNNEKYKTKIAFYTSKIQEQQQKAADQKARKKQIETQFSQWDGSHRNLERVIKQAMHDPDSYDHVKTIYWDRENFIIVQTTYRGKNAFGAVVKNTTRAKVDIDGQVLQILE